MQDVALTDARRLHTRSGHTRRFSSCATCKEDRSHGVSHVPLGMPRSQGPMCAACVLSPSLQPASRTPSREPPTRACRRLRHISYAHPPPPWGPWGGCTRSRCAGRRRRPQVRLDCRRSRSRVDTQTGGPWPNFDLNEYDCSPRPTPRTRDGLQNTQTGSRLGVSDVFSSYALALRASARRRRDQPGDEHADDGRRAVMSGPAGNRTQPMEYHSGPA